MTTRALEFLIGVCLLAALQTLSAEATARKNVLLIAVDDLRPELGCYGASHIHSPNIDRLASEGVLFDRAYCQFALCNPSRTSLMTGMRPERIGVAGNHVHFRDEHPDIITLPQHFKQQGYHAAAIGKIYHGVFRAGESKSLWDTMGDPVSWSEPAIRFGPRYYFTEEGITQGKLAYTQMYGVENPAPGEWTTKLVFGPMTEAPDVSDNALYDGKVADTAVAKLAELKQKGQPFFLAVGFIKPHTPFVAPKKYWDLYDPADIDLADNPMLPQDAPSVAGHTSGEVRRYTDQPKKGPFTDANQRRLKHGYYACISFVDAQVGRVLGELERLGLRENTVVLLYGDHGWHLGEHGLWGKVTNFEMATRAPLIISVPGTKSDSGTQALVEFVDIYPTLCEAAGVPLPPHLDGVSLLPIVRAPKTPGKAAAFSQMGRGTTMGYSVRTDRYRYTEWINQEDGAVEGRELYDHGRESSENVNIAGQPEHGETVKNLSDMLRAPTIFPSSPLLTK